MQVQIKYDIINLPLKRGKLINGANMDSIFIKIIKAYLIKIKQCVEDGNYEIIRREKNRNFILENNLKNEDIINIIMSLSSDDFF